MKNEKMIAMAVVLTFVLSGIAAIAFSDKTEDDQTLGATPQVTLPDAYVGVQYNQSFDTGSVTANNPSIGTKPPQLAWLSITGSNKVLNFSGVPTTAGTYSVTVSMVNYTITVKNVTLSYAANGGTGTMAPNVVTVPSNPFTIPSPTFTAPANHIFAGWNTAANGTGQRVQPGDGVKFIADTTLYAQWSLLSAPTAAFVSSTNGLTVTMTNTSVLADTFSWDFGNGQTSTLKNPTVTYASAGTYTVSLTATGVGGTNTITRNITVSAGSVSAPQPSFIFSVNRELAQFTYTGTTADTLLWNFGDGTTSTSVNPMHSFAASGSYVVTLQATNAGGTNTFTSTVNITIPAAPEPDNGSGNGLIDWIMDNPWTFLVIIAAIITAAYFLLRLL